MEFTSKEARKFSSDGKIDFWVHEFLLSVGNNDKLSKIMKEQNYFSKVKKIKLSDMYRICGPEEGMRFLENEEKFERKINKMVISLKNGWDPAPLILWKQMNNYSIADGCHRFEALKKLGYKEYWAIIWKGNYKDENKPQLL